MFLSFNHYTQFIHIGLKAFLLLALFLWTLLYEQNLGGLLLPLFSLCAGCGSGGDGGGSCGGGSCGGGGGDDSNCGDCTGSESSCGDCCSSGCGGTSTPFLHVWNGKEYVMENDVLMAPYTFYDSPEEGKSSYEANPNGFDEYLISDVVVNGGLSDGTVKLRMKEIEPEESYFDHIVLHRIAYGTDKMLIAQPSRDGFQVFKKNEVEQLSGLRDVSVKTADDVTNSISTSIVDQKIKEHTLEANEQLELIAHLKEVNKLPYVLIRSRYRDWAAGRIEELEHKNSREVEKVSVRSPLQLVRAGVMLALTPLLWLGSGVATDTEKETADDASLLSQHFGYRTAHADHSSHSLVIEYWNHEKKQFVHQVIVQPRSRKSSLEAIALPPEAVHPINKEVRVRVTATKRHIVEMLSLFAPETVGSDEKLETEELTLTNAIHNRTESDVSTVLDTKKPGSYIHMVPGDILDLVFDAKKLSNIKQKNTQYAYRFSIHGFYTKLSRESETLAGDWVSKLDEDALSHLKEMYALKDYHSPNKKPIIA